MLVGCVVFGLGGCVSLEGPEFGVFDPYEKFNRAVYGGSDGLDGAVFAPIAAGYSRVVPDPVERGVRNFFVNLRGVEGIVSGFLQAKPKRGSIAFGRVVVNSTLGIAGIFDVATPLGLADQNEDLGQVFAAWGVTRSRYLVLPVLGPTTLRDWPGLALRAWLPRLMLGTHYSIWVFALDFVSFRADMLQQTRVRDEMALDPYSFTREAYYQRRRYDIFDGNPPLEEFFYEADDAPTSANEVRVSQ